MSANKVLSSASKLARTKLGLDVKSVGAVMVEQAIATRIRKTRLTEEQYLYALETSGTEQEALCQLLLVSESWFEREQQPIESALTELYRNFSQIRALSVPCARGEEAITTLAIAKKVGFHPSLVSIDGYDASENAVEQANLFTYGEYSFRGTSEWFRTHLFSKVGDKYHLSPELQPSLHFNLANVLDPLWRPRCSQYELILCRNLLIYLRPRVRRQLLTKLSELLHPQGLIVATYSEASLLLDVGFKKDQISIAVFSPIQRAINKSANASKKRAKSPTRSAGPRTTPLLKNGTPPISQFHKQPSSRPSESPSTDLTAGIKELADAGRLDEAFALGLQLLEARPNDAQSHFILGVIASCCGQSEEARSWIERALILDPQHEDAKLYMDNVWGRH